LSPREIFINPAGPTTEATALKAICEAATVKAFSPSPWRATVTG